MMPGPAPVVDETFTGWVSQGVRVGEEPYDDVFGRTFVVADPDGNLIPAPPVDGHRSDPRPGECAAGRHLRAPVRGPPRAAPPPRGTASAGALEPRAGTTLGAW